MSRRESGYRRNDDRRRDWDRDGGRDRERDGGRDRERDGGRGRDRDGGRGRDRDGGRGRDRDDERSGYRNFSRSRSSELDRSSPRDLNRSRNSDCSRSRNSDCNRSRHNDSDRSRNSEYGSSRGSDASWRNDSRGSRDSYGERRDSYGRSPRVRGGRGGGRGGQVSGRPSLDHTFITPKYVGEVQDQIPERLEVKAPKMIQLNCATLLLDAAKVVYQYEIKIKGFKGKSDKETGIDIYKTPGTDAARNAKYRTLNDVFKLLLEQNSSIFKSDVMDDDGNPKHLYVFDRSCLFYSDLDFNVDVDERTFSINTRSIHYDNRSYVAGFKKLDIRLVKTGKLNPSNVLGQPLSVQRPILQYLDILFDQHLYKNGDYYVFDNKMFRNDKIKDRNTVNQLFKSGIQKNVRVTANGVVIQYDLKKTCFYNPISLNDFLRNLKFSMNDEASRKIVLSCVKGLYVRTTHLEFNQTFPIAAISNQKANDIYFEYEGSQINVPRYFEKRYHRRLAYPDHHCIEKRGSFYPIEVLEVVDGQRITRERMTPEISNMMLKQCQTKPVELISQLEAELSNAGVANANSILKTSGVRIVDPRLEVQGQEIPKPIIVFENGFMKLQKAGWKQENATYLNGGTINKLALVFDKGCRNERNWTNKLIEVATERGMKIRRNEIMMFTDSVCHDSVQKLVRKLVSSGFDYLMFVCNSSELHAAIKLSEIDTKVCTQQILVTSMRFGDTMSNIVHKLNLKAGGRNFAIGSHPEMAGFDIIKSILSTTCIVGIEMSHPGAQHRADRVLNVDNPEPTTVGITHTVDATGCISMGEYFYIPGGSCVIEHPKLINVIQNAMREFYIKMGKHPKHLLVYRSGISEGSFSEVAEKECGAIVRAIQSINASTAVTMIVVQRKSNFRLFHTRTVLEKMSPNVLADVQNVPAGTSINSTVTNQQYKEFIMVPHSARLGTAKPIVGTVMYESVKDNFSIEQLEYLTHALCYQHEIVYGSIALPGPLQSASELAQRGFNNWKTAFKFDIIKTYTPDYQREQTEEEKKAFIQKTLDKHLRTLGVTIKNKKFWA